VNRMACVVFRPAPVRHRVSSTHEAWPPSSGSRASPSSNAELQLAFAPCDLEKGHKLVSAQLRGSCARATNAVTEVPGRTTS
jgi:hypothetical protein